MNEYTETEGLTVAVCATAFSLTLYGASVCAFVWLSASKSEDAKQQIDEREATGQTDIE